ncbi:hypothetical protein [Sphingomonas bisphenolicum]
MNVMVKSSLIEHWRARKAQVIAWYYKGKVGGGFAYCPYRLKAGPRQIKAPMWNCAVVVENEMMYHTAEACGPSALLRPEGLAIHSTMQADPAGWQITTKDKAIQQLPI